MPGALGGAGRRDRNPAAARPPSTVGPVPARPTGARRRRRACRRRRCRRRRGRCRGRARRPARCAAASFGRPARPRARRRPASRSDLPTGRRRRVTPPAVATSAAKVRLKPSSLARAASTRSPASPSGTGSDATRSRARRGRSESRRSRTGRGVGARSPSAAVPDETPLRRRAAAPRRPAAPRPSCALRLVDASRVPSRLTPRSVSSSTKTTMLDTDEGVGDVVDRGQQPRRRDEVDDVAVAEAGLTEEPVGQVAERAAEQHAEHDRPATSSGCAARRR